MKARILVLSLVLLAACQPVEMDHEYQRTLEEAIPQGDSVFTLTLQATKGAGTKALEVDGKALNGYWVDDEKVGVYVNGTYCGSLTADATGEKSATATLSGTLGPKSILEAGKTITLLFPGRDDKKWDYTGQTGAAPTPGGDLSTKYDFMTAILTINSVGNGKVNITDPARFESEQSIYRFDFKVNDELKAVKWFSLCSNQNQLVTSRSYDNGWISNHGDLTVTLTGDGATSPYVSLRNENITQTDTYTFMVVGGDNALYSGTKEIPAGKLGNGKFLAPSVPLTQSTVGAYGFNYSYEGDIL